MLSTSIYSWARKEEARLRKQARGCLTSVPNAFQKRKCCNGAERSNPSQCAPQGDLCSVRARSPRAQNKQRATPLPFLGIVLQAAGTQKAARDGARRCRCAGGGACCERCLLSGCLQQIWSCDKEHLSSTETAVALLPLVTMGSFVRSPPPSPSHLFVFQSFSPQDSQAGPCQICGAVND